MRRARVLGAMATLRAPSVCRAGPGVAMLVNNGGSSPDAAPSASTVALVNPPRRDHNAPIPGAMAQLGARLHGMQKVEGSSPSGSND